MQGVTVTLGGMTIHAERRLASGRFASMSELVRAGLRAIDRQEAPLDDVIRAKVEEALSDPRAFVTMEEGLAAVRAAVAEQR